MLKLCMFWAYSVLFIILVGYGSAKKGKVLSPVILVPGDGGSQFEAMLDKPSVVHVWCSQKTTTWYPLWLNLELLAPYVLDCLVDNMRMVYHENNHTSSNSPGVTIRVPHFGNTSSVEYLDASEISGTSYYHDLVNSLVSSHFKRDTNIRGAPYDFRKAPNENKEFLADLVKLVEDTYYLNKNQKVVLVGHSMGNPYVLTMLNHTTQAWKDKFVKSYVSLSGPWGGAVKTLRLMASGDNLGVFVVNPLTARQQQRTMPSTAWLLPYDSFWNDTEVLVSGPAGNYTVKDYQKFFQDINFTTGYDLRKDVEPLTLKDLPPPGVDVHCLHGINVTTPASFSYTDKAWYDNQPDVVYGDGDGTVNLRSLHGCLRWANSGHKVIHKTYPGTDHMAILKNKDVINYIVEVATN